MAKELSQRVKELCSEQDIQLKELAEKMNVKPESLSRAINGNPQYTTLVNIAKALSVEFADLFPRRATSEPCASSFTAMVVSDGKTYLFHSREELKGWLLENKA
ncbi:MAG: helix-turn-helix domain-containing protein [Bacteroides sp.]|nr:helix-turn-helix domain-containing protein [Bacteroides sp.]MCM1413882.1 helix-turn-helix domain-containing protein [Bacteroides sp.]